MCLLGLCLNAGKGRQIRLGQELKSVLWFQDVLCVKMWWMLMERKTLLWETLEAEHTGRSWGQGLNSTLGNPDPSLLFLIYWTGGFQVSEAPVLYMDKHGSKGRVYVKNGATAEKSLETSRKWCSSSARAGWLGSIPSQSPSSPQLCLSSWNNGSLK